MNVFTAHDPLPNGLGSRLKEARLAIDYSVGELADAGGVTDKEQKSFEAGRTEPSTLYLRNITRTDIDVMYVLHGVSTQAAVADSGDWRVMHAVFEAVERFSQLHRLHAVSSHMRRRLAEKAYYAFMAARSKELAEESEFDLGAAVELAWNDFTKGIVKT